ncbi:hypothetical protein DIPPA_13696 [Diplonema papillatum]|nr:hypothetical protein DIPPA_13696 [Diplonema papillatum]|eukprot:gene23221-35584_t
MFGPPRHLNTRFREREMEEVMVHQVSKGSDVTGAPISSFRVSQGKSPGWGTRQRRRVPDGSACPSPGPGEYGALFSSFAKASKKRTVALMGSTSRQHNSFVQPTASPGVGHYMPEECKSARSVGPSAVISARESYPRTPRSTAAAPGPGDYAYETSSFVKAASPSQRKPDGYHSRETEMWKHCEESMGSPGPGDYEPGDMYKARSYRSAMSRPTLGGTSPGRNTFGYVNSFYVPTRPATDAGPGDITLRSDFDVPSFNTFAKQQTSRKQAVCCPSPTSSVRRSRSRSASNPASLSPYIVQMTKSDAFQHSPPPSSPPSHGGYGHRDNVAQHAAYDRHRS